MQTRDDLVIMRGLETSSCEERHTVQGNKVTEIRVNPLEQRHTCIPTLITYDIDIAIDYCP